MIFRILNFLDMIIEGFFFFGGVVVVILIIKGVNFFLVIFVVVAVGCLVGMAVGFFYIKGKILILFLGILVMIFCYFIMFLIMGRVNLGLFGIK